MASASDCGPRTRRRILTPWSGNHGAGFPLLDGLNPASHNVIPGLPYFLFGSIRVNFVPQTGQVP